MLKRRSFLSSLAIPFLPIQIFAPPSARGKKIAVRRFDHGPYLDGPFLPLFDTAFPGLPGEPYPVCTWTLVWPLGEQRPWPIHYWMIRRLHPGEMLLKRAALLWGDKHSSRGYVEFMPDGFSIACSSPEYNTKFRVVDKFNDPIHANGVDCLSTEWKELPRPIQI